MLLVFRRGYRGGSVARSRYTLGTRGTGGKEAAGSWLGKVSSGSTPIELTHPRSLNERERPRLKCSRRLPKLLLNDGRRRVGDGVVGVVGVE